MVVLEWGVIVVWGWFFYDLGVRNLVNLLRILGEDLLCFVVGIVDEVISYLRVLVIFLLSVLFFFFDIGILVLMIFIWFV